MAAASLNVTLPNSRQQQAMKKISAAQLIGDELRNAQRKDAEPFRQRQQGDQGQGSQFHQERHVLHLRIVISVSF